MVVSGEIKKKQTGATRVCVCVVYVYIYRYIANYSYGSIIIQNKLYAGMYMCVYVYIYIITVVVFCIVSRVFHHSILLIFSTTT